MSISPQGDAGDSKERGWPTVIYIAGWGRSGSTMLEESLARVGMLAAGEIERFWDLSFHQQVCACGEPYGDCPFWSAIVRRVESADIDITETRRLRRQMLRFRRVPMYIGISNLAFGAIADASASLYRALAIEGHSRVIVDASKNPLLPLLSGRNLETQIDFRVVHLVRDPRAVAYSWLNPKLLPSGRMMPTYGPVHSGIQWSMRNIIASLATNRARSGRMLRYEDLAQSPERELRNLVDWIGVGADSQKIDSSPFLHGVEGNPSRRQNTRIDRDDRWLSEMRRVDRALASCSSWPARKFLGY